MQFLSRRGFTAVLASLILAGQTPSPAAAGTPALVHSQVRTEADAAPPLAEHGWQCAQFARLFSGIEIFGDAWTWWAQAVGRYSRGLTPESGAVLVFKPGGALTRGHVSVVEHVLTDRIIQVTHANWSPVNGQRGQIEKEVTVVDVSAQGDWSKVKVWFNPSGDLGTTVYPTFGFVYRGAAGAVRAAGAAADAFDRSSRVALAAEVEQALR